MAVSYPTGLNIPLISGYSHLENQKTRMDDVETGPPRFELLSEHGPVIFNVIWSFNAVDFQLFEGWWKHELTFGANAFDLTLKVGAGLKSHECSFIKSYKPSLIGKRWKVSAQLVGVAKVYDVLADYNVLVALRSNIGGDLDAFADGLNNIVEQVLPDSLGA